MTATAPAARPILPRNRWSEPEMGSYFRAARRSRRSSFLRIPSTRYLFQSSRGTGINGQLGRRSCQERTASFGICVPKRRGAGGASTRRCKLPHVRTAFRTMIAKYLCLFAPRPQWSGGPTSSGPDFACSIVCQDARNRVGDCQRGNEPGATKGKERSNEDKRAARPANSIPMNCKPQCAGHRPLFFEMLVLQAGQHQDKKPDSLKLASFCKIYIPGEFVFANDINA